MTGRQLKKLRVSKGLSQEALARILNCSVFTVQSWECGRNPISKITEIAIKSVLNNNPATRRSYAATSRREK